MESFLHARVATKKMQILYVYHVLMVLIKFRWCDIVKMFVVVPPACLVVERFPNRFECVSFGCKIQPMDDVTQLGNHPYYPSTTLWPATANVTAGRRSRAQASHVASSP